MNNGNNFHMHTGADGTPRLNPQYFKGFVNNLVSDATTAPTDTPDFGTPRFLYDGTNYVMWVYLNNIWKSMGSVTISQIISALGYTPESTSNKVTTITGVSDTNYPSEKAVYSYIAPFNPGTLLVVSADTSRNTNSATPYKLKEIQMNRGGNGITIAFDYQRGAGAGSTQYIQIYKNGSAYGNQISNNVNDAVWVNVSQDFASSPFVNTDKFQLYAWTTNSSYAIAIRNFRIYKLAETTVNTD